jgi:hypothetical protein
MPLTYRSPTHEAVSEVCFFWARNPPNKKDLMGPSLMSHLSSKTWSPPLQNQKMERASTRPKVVPPLRVTLTELVADITPSSQPDRALSALTSGLKPSCNLSQSRHGRTSIACAHTTGDSNTNLSQVSYRDLLTTQYKQGCNQCEYFHTQVYQKLNTHKLHLNAPYKHLSVSVPTWPVERTN